MKHCWLVLSRKFISEQQAFAAMRCLALEALGSRWYLCRFRPRIVPISPSLRWMASSEQIEDKSLKKARWKEEQLKRTEARLRKKRVFNTRLDGSTKTYDKKPLPITKLDGPYESYTLVPFEEERVERKREAKLNRRLKELWETYLENMLLGANAEREAALARDGRLSLRLPEREMEMRGLAICGLRFDRTWGAVSVGKTVQVDKRIYMTNIMLYFLRFR